MKITQAVARGGIRYPLGARQSKQAHRASASLGPSFSSRSGRLYLIRSLAQWESARLCRRTENSSSVFSTTGKSCSDNYTSNE